MSLDIFSLKNKVAIVTGSGRNIGKALALGLAECGADIVAVARTAAEIDQTAKEIEARGRKALAIPTDVRESEPVDSMVQKTIKELGRIDILINHAGGVFTAKTLEMSERAWDAIIRENLRGTFLCTKAVAKAMIEHKWKGSIVNTSSLAGVGPATENSSYGVAKAGIINFTQTLAVELAPHHIRVNAIAPGMIVHAGSAAFFQIDKPGVVERLVANIPLKRYGTPEDIVGAVVYLASDAADFVTGATILISGGQFSSALSPA